MVVVAIEEVQNALHIKIITLHKRVSTDNLQTFFEMFKQ